jgi:hypothetical protein
MRPKWLSAATSTIARNSSPHIVTRWAGFGTSYAPFPQEIRQRVLDRLWQMAGLSPEGGFPKQGVLASGIAGRQVEWRLQMESASLGFSI